MARFYTDENFVLDVVHALRDLGHDVLTAYEAQQANLSISDQDVLSFAIKTERAVITFDRHDYIRLHRIDNNHFGIIVCTFKLQPVDLANKIHEAVLQTESLERKLIRIYKGDHPPFSVS